MTPKPGRDSTLSGAFPIGRSQEIIRTEREAHIFEASVLTSTAAGEIVDPRSARVPLATVYKSWMALRVDLSPKVRRGYQDIWRFD